MDSSRWRVAKRGARALRQTRNGTIASRPSVRNKELLHFTRTTRRRDYQSDISLLRSKWDSDGLKETVLLTVARSTSRNR